MLNHVFSLICQSVTTEDDGNITLNKVITSGSVSGVPSTMPGFSIVSMWSYEKDELDTAKSSFVRCRLKTPSRTMVIAKIDIAHGDTSNISRVILELDRFPVNELGSYFIYIDKHMKNRWKNVACIPLVIVEKSKPENQSRKQRSEKAKQT